MKRILLIKTSSLGDVVHNLPVVGDIRRAFANVAIDWAVERGFADIPRRHPGVARAIEVELRRWRRAFWRSGVRAEVSAALGQLTRETYDAVIDTQGLMKSAWLAWRARGPAYGKDWASAREPVSLFYDRSFAIPWTLHAVERNRLLAARALGYRVEGAPEFGLARAPDTGGGEPYAVLLHATSAQSKLWPETHWIELADSLHARGLRCVLPWGNAPERARSERLAAALTGARVPPALALAEVFDLLAGARVVIGLDTGLTHLAAALGVPVVGIYVSTDPAATGIYGCPRAINVGDGGSPPPVTAVTAALERVRA